MEHAAFEEQGFAIFPDVLSSQEIAGLVNESAFLPSGKGKAGVRHLLSHPSISAFAHHPPILATAKRLLGCDPIPFSATLFNKSADANWLIPWHQDTALPLREKRAMPGWVSWSVKEAVIYAHAPAEVLSQIVAIRIHLDDSNATNGALRVLPGTHNMGVLTDDEIHQCSTQIPDVTCTVASGGILAMRPLLVHSSSKAHLDVSRRVLHIQYSASTNFNEARLAVA